MLTDIDGEPDDDSYSEGAGSPAMLLHYKNAATAVTPGALACTTISGGMSDKDDKVSVNSVKIGGDSSSDRSEKDNEQSEIPNNGSSDDQASVTETEKNVNSNQDGVNTCTQNIRCNGRSLNLFWKKVPNEVQSSSCRYKRNHRRHAQEKPPIIFDSSTEIPESLKHLPKDTRITIFDRKAGIVLSGDAAPKLCDLPYVLSQNAGYEPVYPDMFDGSPGNCRIGKSSEKIRIRASICPQNHIVRSGRSMKGKRIVVKSGPYKGSIGELFVMRYIWVCPISLFWLSRSW